MNTLSDRQILARLHLLVPDMRDPALLDSILDKEVEILIFEFMARRLEAFREGAFQNEINIGLPEKRRD